LLVVILIPLLLHAAITQELAGVDSLNVGTPFTFIIHSNSNIKGVSIPDTLESFAIVQSKQAQDNNSWQMTIVPLKLGALTFPRLQVMQQNNSLEPDSTDAFRVYVLSTLAEGDTLLRDIKPLEHYPLQPPLWLYIIIAVLGLVLAMYLVVRKLRQTPKVIAPPPIIIPKAIPAWEKALTELDALLSETLFEQGEELLFHFRISEILRSFLEANYHFAAREMTGSEIIAHIRKHKINRSDELRCFLNYCDMVKFAKAEPSMAEIQQWIQWLRDYLNSFRMQTTGAAK
jgi:hypothetical protein